MSQWAEFLRKLNAGGGREVVASWRMSDGAMLQKAIPAAALIQDEELDDREFDYKLYHILEIEFTSDFDEIEQAARSSGLIYRRKPDRIVVRSPYTC